MSSWGRRIECVDSIKTKVPGKERKGENMEVVEK
jgi:peptide subunit release factor 1 (eRF1)